MQAMLLESSGRPSDALPLSQKNNPLTASGIRFILPLLYREMENRYRDRYRDRYRQVQIQVQIGIDRYRYRYRYRYREMENRYRAGRHPVTLLKNGPTPASFLLIFVFSNKHYKFYNKYECEKCPSSIRHRDSNSQPSDYESPPLTTRPGLPPNIR